MDRIPASFVNRLARASLASLLFVSISGCAVLRPGLPGSCDDPAWKTGTPDQIKAIALKDGQTAPFFLAAFDRGGEACSSSKSPAAIRALSAGGITDLYVICSGWGVSGSGSAAWMESFATGYERVRSVANPAQAGMSYRPLYLGVLWPTDVMVEANPAPAPQAQRHASKADADRKALAEVLDTDVEPARFARIQQELIDRGHGIRSNRLEQLLVKAAQLSPPEQLDLADCLLPLYGEQEEPSAPGPRFAVMGTRLPPKRIPSASRSGLIGVDPSPLPNMDAAELLATWKRSVREASADVPRSADVPGDDSSRARRRGLSMNELVRWALRATDLRLLKDRAYRVGSSGLAELLAAAHAAAPAARIHLVGHSFGCEALLAAMTANSHTPIDTALLLEPAVSAWTLAPAPIVGPDVSPVLQSYSRAGVYRPAIERVSRSIVVTYSTKDWVTSYYLPKALRRPALDGLASPDDWSGGNGFAQMGGIGPAGMDPAVQRFDLVLTRAEEMPARYVWENAGHKLIAVDGSETIRSHGDINNSNIWWLLANQVQLGE